MISVSKACDIIYNMYDKKIYITNINDVGYGYVFSVVGLNGEEYDVPADIVNKETGETGVFPFWRHQNELKNSKKIDVPEKYKAT